MPTPHPETHINKKASSPQQHRPRTSSPAPVVHHPAAIIQRAQAAPESLSVADVLQLQRTIGNQAVGRLLAGVGQSMGQNQNHRQSQPVQLQEMGGEECLQCKITEAMQRQPKPDDEELIQGKFASGLTGPLQAKGEASPNRTGMPDHLKSGIEHLSGMDLSGVRVHYNSSKPIQLNALAYTRGQEIHVGSGQERHLAHEGWHVVQQMQGRVQPTGEVAGMSLNDSRALESEADSMGQKSLQMYAQMGIRNDRKSSGIANSVTQKLMINNDPVLSKANHQNGIVVQGVFVPAITTGKAHLRNYNVDGVDSGTHVGRKIPSGSEVVIDREAQDEEYKCLCSNVTWTKAVDVTAANWDPAIHKAQNLYIRDSKVRPKHYPIRNTHWHEDVGEYAVKTDSIDVANARIIKVGNTFKRLTQDFQLQDLSTKEQTQIDRKPVVGDRLRTILRGAVDDGVDQDVLVTDHNVDKLEKHLRIGLSKNGSDQHLKWYDWSQNVFERIEEGADHLVASLLHWREWLYPEDANECDIISISLTGSDLHDEGLGAVIVEFNKPEGGNALFPGDEVKVVIKPESRELEKSLLGSQEGSLVNEINEYICEGDEIQSIKMESSDEYGSIIEFISGLQPSGGDGDSHDSALETIAFAYITGMFDLQHENVLWKDGKPYLIDADNALRKTELSEGPHSQTGFSQYDSDLVEETRIMREAPETSGSDIMNELVEDAAPIIDLVKGAFRGKSGRVVPIHTQRWAYTLESSVTMDPETREGLADWLATKVPDGWDGSKGLRGEAGESLAGNRYNEERESVEIEDDFDYGKIPFYTYHYDVGEVKHNGAIVWYGQTLDQAMASLLGKFVD